jgi:hypothetical protein
LLASEVTLGCAVFHSNYKSSAVIALREKRSNNVPIKQQVLKDYKQFVGMLLASKPLRAFVSVAAELPIESIEPVTPLISYLLIGT